MNTEQAAIAGLTVAVAVAVVDVFAKTLPPPHAVYGQPATPAAVADVRRQCVSVLPMALAFGAGAALLARSPWPLVGAAAGIAWMWRQYDAAARNDAGQQLGAATPARRYGT